MTKIVTDPFVFLDGDNKYWSIPSITINVLDEEEPDDSHDDIPDDEPDDDDNGDDGQDEGHDDEIPTPDPDDGDDGTDENIPAGDDNPTDTAPDEQPDSQWVLPSGRLDPNEPGISNKEKKKRQMFIDRDAAHAGDTEEQEEQDESTDPGEDPDQTPDEDLPPEASDPDPIPPVVIPPQPPVEGIVAIPLPAAQLRGVNIAGADFTPGKTPGVKGQQYYYPNINHLGYWEPTGINCIRYPFKMARIFNEDNSPRDLADLYKHVTAMTGAGYYIVLDPHDYANQFDYAISKGVTMTTQVQFDKFAAQWRIIAALFADNPRVIFGLMNEPQGKVLTIDLWFANAQGAINAIRQVAGNHIFVPGLNWANASLFPQNSGPTLKNLNDPLNNFSFEGHQYANKNNSGANGSCATPTILVDRIEKATLWGRANGFKFFLGEFGAGDGADCVGVIEGALDHMATNSDVWSGWTVWGGGRWWPDSYHYNISPIENPVNGPVGSQPNLLSHYIPYFTGKLA